tara:strand:- start:686 stop:853 length:168 start_codon:yes stop_codon:yes gene_type:complete
MNNDKQTLRALLGQLISIKNDLEKLINSGIDWEKMTELYDDIRHVIAELERVIDK